jgi:hypothetical protein
MNPNSMELAAWIRCLFLLVAGWNQVEADWRSLAAGATSTGWQVVAVPGLVPDEIFFARIASRAATRVS